MASQFVFLLMGTLALFLSACASSSHVSREYNELIRGKLERTSSRTVLVFLVDGLPISTLQGEIDSGKLPQIQKYFLRSQKQFHLARSTFPSLTFPGIGALLTEKPVDQNGIYGNLIWQDGDQIGFESPQNLEKLNQMIQGNNIFSRLKARGLKTVSIDYAFYADSDVHMESQDAEVALAILKKDYSGADSKLIGSLQTLLEQTETKKWPDFIFVHLIGVDLLSHDKGPHSREVKKYLRFLDEELTGVFQILSRVETKKEREVVALLTSDHGYDKEVSQTLDLEQVLENVDGQIEVLNEGRFAGLFFPRTWSAEKRGTLLENIVSHPLMDIVARREADQIFIQSRSQEVVVSYGTGACRESSFAISVVPTENFLMKTARTPMVCPENLNANLDQLFYPYFMSNLSHYFQSSDRPDALVIPKPGVAFKEISRGQHGGPTTQETFVPLLIRNGTLGNSHKVPALWELLRFM